MLDSFAHAVVASSAGYGAAQTPTAAARARAAWSRLMERRTLVAPPAPPPRPFTQQC